MTILLDTARTVKPARRTFGRGILASRPTYHAPYTAADAIWAAENLNAAATDYDVVDFDVMAADAAAMDRIEAGYCL